MSKHPSHRVSSGGCQGGISYVLFKNDPICIVWCIWCTLSLHKKTPVAAICHDKPTPMSPVHQACVSIGLQSSKLQQQHARNTQKQTKYFVTGRERCIGREFSIQVCIEKTLCWRCLDIGQEDGFFTRYGVCVAFFLAMCEIHFVYADVSFAFVALHRYKIQECSNFQ